MRIINNTAMIFTHDHEKITAQINYDLQAGIKIIPSETYRNTLIENKHSGQGTDFFVHELNERLIREGKVRVHDRDYSALNAVSFLTFVKNKLSCNEPPPQTIAHFLLPTLNHEERLIFTLKDSFKESIDFGKLPWKVTQLQNHRLHSIPAQFQTIEYYPVLKKISAIIAYHPAYHEGVNIDYTHVA
jgi:hypothetical protein